MTRHNSYILMGGSDDTNGDYSLLKKLSQRKSKRSAGHWSCLKDARVGDELWFYITSPNRAVVAVGEAAGDADVGKNWPYECPIRNVEWIDPPITRDELQELFSDWDWTRSTRGKTHLTEQRARVLRTRKKKKTQASASPHSPPSHGAGFGSAEENGRVEKAAIRYTRQLYRDRGFAIESVERDRVGYDLLATKGRRTLHVAR